MLVTNYGEFGVFLRSGTGSATINYTYAASDPLCDGHWKWNLHRTVRGLASGDVDADGDEDLLLGDDSGTLKVLLRGRGDDTAATWSLEYNNNLDPAQSLNAAAMGGISRSSPTFIDDLNGYLRPLPPIFLHLCRPEARISL